MAQVIIVHGTRGSPDGNWFAWLKTEMAACGHKVHVPRFPTPEDQHPDNWLGTLQNIGAAPDILIGHSIGATFLLHVLQTVKVKQSVFVAPVMDALGFPDYDVLNQPFHDFPFNWDRINANKGSAHIFHGADDPYVPVSHAETLAAKLAAPLTLVPGGGHLNAESGYTTFPLLMNFL